MSKCPGTTTLPLDSFEDTDSLMLVHAQSSARSIESFFAAISMTDPKAVQVLHQLILTIQYFHCQGRLWQFAASRRLPMKATVYTVERLV